MHNSFASAFTIARRRMVVPIHKKWEASLARIQVVQQEKVVQLLAFFADFNHGKCMNFVLKGTDVLETFGRSSGKTGVRIVDAKFAFPRDDGDPSSWFICLDMPDYASEHDDISIVFNSDSGMFCPLFFWSISFCTVTNRSFSLGFVLDRANFQSVFPGSVRKARII